MRLQQKRVMLLSLLCLMLTVAVAGCTIPSYEGTIVIENTDDRPAWYAMRSTRDTSDIPSVDRSDPEDSGAPRLTKGFTMLPARSTYFWSLSRWILLEPESIVITVWRDGAWDTEVYTPRNDKFYLYLTWDGTELTVDPQPFFK